MCTSFRQFPMLHGICLLLPQLNFGQRSVVEDLFPRVGRRRVCCRQILAGYQDTSLCRLLRHSNVGKDAFLLSETMIYHNNAIAGMVHTQSIPMQHHACSIAVNCMQQHAACCIYASSPSNQQYLWGRSSTDANCSRILCPRKPWPYTQQTWSSTGQY